jgi:phasin
MATPRKQKPSSTGSKLAKKITSAPEKIMAMAAEAVETPRQGPGVIPPALDTLIQETAEKAVADARDAQETLRCATEDALVQTRAAYDKMKHAAEDVTETIETSYVTVTRGIGQLNQKALESLKAQADANLEHFKALAAARSLPEAFTLQTDYARKQFESISNQMKEMTALAQKVATEAAEPLKTSFGKSLAA